MADGEAGPTPGGAANDHGNDAPAITTDHPSYQPNSFNDDKYAISPRINTAPSNPFASHQHTGIELDDYFTGPRDLTKHSKWPLFLQLQGSITPKMIVPLLSIGAWATLITAISEKVPGVSLSIQPVLLTITGFVISLGLSFRSSTAYERYGEGRKCWAQLTLASQALGRVFWINIKERPDSAKQDVLAKLTAMNLVVAFAVAMKHRLRFEPYTHYEDLADLVGHIDSIAKEATEHGPIEPKKMSIFHHIGEHLGLSFATSNPRKTLKRTKKPLGNLPLEILAYLTAFADETCGNGQLTVPMQQTALYNGIASLNDAMVSMERVLNTPLPLAYAIAISQITWLYIILLPFQLYNNLGWITIPATVLGAYIILGLFFIGHEIENPFGTDVNDLPLDGFCQQIMEDMNTVASHGKIQPSQFIRNARNKVMYPVSQSSYFSWETQSEGAIRTALKDRPQALFQKPQTATESV
ncbi:Bestrophin, RFP-TM, chloride channel-domain-containing protein [Xylariaceae sp. FL0255]|nr:Bestrophin, RFP-TM, chloride channel-domain-containing protein [Xylariaceae sp. FL0255]